MNSYKELFIFKITIVFFMLIQTVNGFASETIDVAVSIAPLAEFVEQVGQNRVNVHVMIPQGADPHHYEPTAQQLKSLSQAQLYVKVGTSIDAELMWIPKLLELNSQMIVVDASQKIRLIQMQHAHFSGSQQSGKIHEYQDPHIWLSPQNAKRMVANIYTVFIQMDPDHIEVYGDNASRYIEQLTDLDKEISEQLKPYVHKSIFVGHPTWGYFADRYGLKQVSIEREGKEPTARGLIQFIQDAKNENISVIFVSKQFNQKSIQTLTNEVGARIQYADPLAKNYVSNLKSFTHHLVEAFHETEEDRR